MIRPFSKGMLAKNHGSCPRPSSRPPIICTGFLLCLLVLALKLDVQWGTGVMVQTPQKNQNFWDCIFLNDTPMTVCKCVSQISSKHWVISHIYFRRVKCSRWKMYYDLIHCNKSELHRTDKKVLNCFFQGHLMSLAL